MLTHTGTQTIETERLILRRFQYTDDDAMLRYWVADEKIDHPSNLFERLRAYFPSLLRWLKVAFSALRAKISG